MRAILVSREEVQACRAFWMAVSFSSSVPLRDATAAWTSLRRDWFEPSFTADSMRASLSARDRLESPMARITSL